MPCSFLGRASYLDNSFETNFAGKQVESYFSQAVLPLALLQEAIKLPFFILRLENLLDNFKWEILKYGYKISHNNV